MSYRFICVEVAFTSVSLYTLDPTAGTYIYKSDGTVTMFCIADRSGDSRAYDFSFSVLLMGTDVHWGFIIEQLR